MYPIFVVMILQKRILEVCTDNFSLGTNDVIAQISREYPDIEVKSWRCISNCQQCFRVPFVLYNESIVISAPDAAALLQKLRDTFAAERL